MNEHRLGGLRRLFRRTPAPAAWHEQLEARLAEQDAAIARLLLALEQAHLALDRRLLDHYALTELARAEAHLRADAIDTALSSPDGPVAELLAAEGALIDGYLIHHTAMLARQIGTAKAVIAPPAPDLDLLVTAGGYDIVVPSSEQDLIASLRRQGLDDIEPGVRAVLGRELRAGAVAVAVDVGANIGLHALTIAAAVGPEGSLICFEPAPRLAVSLRRTLALNGFAARAEVRAITLADAEGTSRSSLDAQIPVGTHVDLVKLDVEGAEPLVWRGSERVRRENPAIVFVLAWSAPQLIRAGFDPAAVMAEIRADGSAVFVIATDDPSGALAPLEDDPAGLIDANLLLRRS